MEERYIENYWELEKHRKSSFRGMARKLALDTFSIFFKSSGKTGDLLRKPRVQFLYIHHIFKDEEPALRRLIGRLAKDHSFISYREAVSRILSGDIDKPYIAISSDDGLKNNARAAAVLSEYGISACFFICPPMIGQKNFEEIKRFSNQRLHLPPVEFMNWSEIEELQKSGHEIGGHTMSHVNLASCSINEAHAEIEGCYTEIVKRCGSVDHFAFPFGRFHHFNRVAKNIVFSTGFATCASAERGCHITDGKAIPNPRDLFIRRDHIILTWPVEHIFFFMARNMQKANLENNYFPSHEDSDSDQ